MQNENSCAEICQRSEVLHEGPRVASRLFIAVMEVDQGIPDEQRAMLAHEVSNYGAIRTRRWIANPSAPNLQTIRFRDAEIKQPLLGNAQGIFAIQIEHRALLHGVPCEPLTPGDSASNGVSHPSLASATFRGDEINAGERDDAVDQPFDGLL